MNKLDIPKAMHTILTNMTLGEQIKWQCDSRNVNFIKAKSSIIYNKI